MQFCSGFGLVGSNLNFVENPAIPVRIQKIYRTLKNCKFSNCQELFKMISSNVAGVGFDISVANNADECSGHAFLNNMNFVTKRFFNVRFASEEFFAPHLGRCQENQVCTIYDSIHKINGQRP